jgi:Ca2+-binding EF-hand superfamily protein
MGLCSSNAVDESPPQGVAPAKPQASPSPSPAPASAPAPSTAAAARASASAIATATAATVAVPARPPSATSSIAAEAAEAGDVVGDLTQRGPSPSAALMYKVRSPVLKPEAKRTRYSATGEDLFASRSTPHMRGERDRWQAKRANRSMTVRDQQWETMLDLDHEHNRYLKKVVHALDAFKVKDPIMRRDAVENFSVLDAELKGFILAEEMRLLIETLDAPLNEDRIDTLMMAADPEGSGHVDPRHYVECLVQVRAYANRKREELKEMYDIMDEQGRGFVPRAEVTELMQEIDPRLTPQVTQVLLDRIELGPNDDVYLQDFMALMKLLGDDDDD